jgi:hypothetical protein
MRRVILYIALVVSVACSPKPVPKTEIIAVEPPPDQSDRFPEAGLTKMDRVADHLLGKTFMPGGNLATYDKGFQQFLGKMPDAQQAAFLLLDWKKALTDAKYLPHMGGYFGTDAGKSVYVFTKGTWVAGIVGLPEVQADTIARQFAARL